MTQHSFSAKCIDEAVVEVQQLASNDDEQKRIEAAIQVGLMKGLSLALGNRMPDPFETQKTS